LTATGGNCISQILLIFNEDESLNCQAHLKKGSFAIKYIEFLGYDTGGGQKLIDGSIRKLNVICLTSAAN
jgi:hypothetical protein